MKMENSQFISILIEASELTPEAALKRLKSEKRRKVERYQRITSLPVLHDIDCLGIDELPDPLHGEFTSIPGTPGSAKWQTRVGLHQFIDEVGAISHAICIPKGFVNIFREDGDSQTVSGLVGQIKRLILIGNTRYGGNRTECLLIKDSHARTYIGKDGGFIETVLVTAAGLQLCTHLYRALHLLMELFSQLFSCHSTNLGIVSERIARTLPLHAVC